MTEPSWGIMLLEDCRTILSERKLDQIPTVDLIGFLQTIEESPWSEELDGKGAARKLARLLKPYGIRPGTIRISETETPKGYKAKSFKDAWKRLLPPPSQNSATSDTTPQPSI
jgi:hypothetical protein